MTLLTSDTEFLFSAHLQRAAEWISEATGLLITAGAGIGVDSGLPDFRGDAGFWRVYPALEAHGFSFCDIAQPESFASSPLLAWGFYGHRLALYRGTTPHAGFGLLRQWADRRERGAFVFTSNVDGQFQKAGFSPNQIVECHGSIQYMQCVLPCSQRIWSAAAEQATVDIASCQLTSPLPRCADCGGLARPNILMFNDGSWIGARSHMQQIQLDAWLHKNPKPLVIEIGAGMAIPRVRHLSERHAGRLIRINPADPSMLDERRIQLPLGALAALQGISAYLPSD